MRPNFRSEPKLLKFIGTVFKSHELAVASLNKSLHFNRYKKQLK